MSLSALVILAPGFEEIEAITPIDILRRAEFSVTVAGTVAGSISAARQTRHQPDVELDAVKDQLFDIVILPGGAGGTANLKADTRVKEILERHKRERRWIAAICAAPTILHAHGLLEPPQRITCHPSEQANIPATQLQGGSRVVVSGKIITSLAAGSAMEFAYAIVEQLLGKDAVAKVNQGVCSLVAPKQHAVFLDRDGVVNASVVRNGRPFPPQTLEEFVLLPGATDACSRLKRAGYLLVVVTNQPDVGRGTQPQKVVEEMNQDLVENLPIDAVKVCYDPRDEEGSRRKPSPAMLLEAAREFNIDLSQSYIVGDRWRDIDSGYNAGCRTIFIDHNYNEKLKRQPEFSVKNLSEAARIILQQ
jgi:DJ-1 family protein